MHNLSKAQYESIINQVNLELKTILREEQDMMILKEYQMYDFFYGHQLNEALSPQSKKDLRELQNVLGNLGKVCARLMYRLIKWGAKKSVKLCVKAANAAYRAGKEKPEICKKFLQISGFSLPALYAACAALTHNLTDFLAPHFIRRYIKRAHTLPRLPRIFCNSFKSFLLCGLNSSFN